MKTTENLGVDMMAGIEAIRNLLGNTETLPVNFRGEIYQVEYLIIPATSRKGESLAPIFNYPGGGTHLGPCIEPFIYLDRESIIISPLGYGKSSDPSPEVWSNPFHGAEVSLQVLEDLGLEKIILYGHSNAAPVVLKMALRAHEFGIGIEEIILINPIGLRRFSRVWPALAYSVSGAFTRIASWFHTHPYKLIKSAYRKTRHSFSFQKIGYELKKSSAGLVPDLLWEIGGQGLKIPVTVIQSSFDWGRLHLPWSKSNEEILRDCYPDDILKFVFLPGLHNITLGKDSENLARVIGQSFWTALILATVFLPCIPALCRALG